MRQEAPNRDVMARVSKGVAVHKCAARVLNQNHTCGFYIIILNKPVARHYKNTHSDCFGNWNHYKKQAKYSRMQLCAHFCTEKTETK